VPPAPAARRQHQGCAAVSSAAGPIHPPIPRLAGPAESSAPAPSWPAARVTWSVGDGRDQPVHGPNRIRRISRLSMTHKGRRCRRRYSAHTANQRCRCTPACTERLGAADVPVLASGRKSPNIAGRRAPAHLNTRRFGCSCLGSRLWVEEVARKAKGTGISPPRRFAPSPGSPGEPRGLVRLRSLQPCAGKT